jgi:anaerobic selenocysteine-containing dehydrogenase
MVAGAEKSWDEALSAVSEALKSAQAGGKKVAWLGHARSGATGALISTFLAAFGAKPFYWEPLSGMVALRAATREVFGLDKVPAFDLASAHTVVSFGAEFLSTWGGLDLSRAWGDSRDPAMGGFVSRTVCVEPRLGNTSVNTDLHLAAKPGTEALVAMALARLVAEKR